MNLGERQYETGTYFVVPGIPGCSVGVMLYNSGRDSSMAVERFVLDLVLAV